MIKPYHTIWRNIFHSKSNISMFWLWNTCNK